MRRCTDITIILDKSDSMSDCHPATIEMVNSFVDARRHDIDPVITSLILFSDHCPERDFVFTHSAIDVKDLPRFTPANYRLNGMTALRDAICRTVLRTGERLAKMPERDRPDRVVIVVVTDGGENNSKYFDQPTTTRMVEEQQKTYSWEFIYLGADMTSIKAAQQARDVGILNHTNYLKAATPQASALLNDAMTEYSKGHTAPAAHGGPGFFAITQDVAVRTCGLSAQADTALGGGPVNMAPPAKSTRPRGRPRKAK